MEDIKEYVNQLDFESLLNKWKNEGEDDGERNYMLDECLDSLKEEECNCHHYYYLEACQFRVWEKLNTGHWKDVELIWRQIYSILMLLRVRVVINNKKYPSNPDVGLLEDLIKMCDMGILMGAPILSNACQKLATKFSQLIAAFESPKESTSKKRKTEILLKPPRVAIRDGNITELDELSIEDFIQNYKLVKKPVVINSMMNDWPALSKWSVSYFKKLMGYRHAPVELGTRYTDDDWTQQIMSIKEFIENFVDEENTIKGYLAQHQLLDQVPELKEDIEVPEYCHTGEEEDVDINFWFGPANTISPLHTDPKHNFLCQVFGQKYLKLYDPDQTECLYPYDDSELLSNTSRIDLENVDLGEFFNFPQAQGLNCILKPGQMLYIPPKHWHFVKSLSPSCSLSFWFE